MVYIFIILLVTVVLYAGLAGYEMFLEHRLELKKLDQNVKEVSNVED